MCGGAGTRLRPASRENRPKQFLPLFGPLSTFQETVRRVSDPALFGRPVVVTNAQYQFLVAEQLAAIGVKADILLEPVRRDSGPAIVVSESYLFDVMGERRTIVANQGAKMRQKSGTAKTPSEQVSCDMAAISRIVQDIGISVQVARNEVQSRPQENPKEHSLLRPFAFALQSQYPTFGYFRICQSAAQAI
jgi:mannose-1-phosphate guanylyltransferase